MFTITKLKSKVPRAVHNAETEQIAMWSNDKLRKSTHIFFSTCDRSLAMETADLLPRSPGDGKQDYPGDPVVAVIDCYHKFNLCTYDFNL